MRSIVHIFAVLVILHMFSCSTEVDNYADYKDITVVYGLLDSKADTNFIKITKAFLGPGNALLIAQNPDSSQYTGKLNVKLLGVKNGGSLPEITLDTITIQNKLAGDSIFYFPQQKLYYTTAAIDPEATYTLRILRGDKVVEAQTKVVKDFAIMEPVNRVNFASTVASAVKWKAAPNARRHEAVMVFNFMELWPGSADTVHKTMTWNLGTVTSKNTNGSETLEIAYQGDEFFTRLAAVIDQDAPNVKRYTGKVDIYISAGGDDLTTYIEVNAPSNSIIQEVPQFTNIENGIGIFSSRSTVKRTYSMTVQSETKLVEAYPWGFAFKFVP